MKYTLTILALFLAIFANAQTLQWNQFSTTPSLMTNNFATTNQIANMVTNFTASSEVIVTAAANLVTNYTAFSTLSLSAISNAPNIFGPWDGANYVQSAVNALSYQPSTLTQTAGGKVLVLGMNNIPATLVISNHFYYTDGINEYFQSNVLAIAFESPDHKGNGFVCYGNPGILIAGQDPQGDGVGTMSPTFKNLIIASAVSGTNYLIYEAVSSIANQRWEDCYIAGSWWQVTNNQLFAYVGLATPSVHSNPWTNDSAIYFQGLDSDLSYFSGNHFCWLAGIIQNCDHAEFHNNFFMADGATPNFPPHHTMAYTHWPTNSAFCSGAALIQINTGEEAVMYHNNFYDCGAAYYCATLSGAISQTNLFLKNSGFAWISYNDKYESTHISVVYIQTNGVFEQIDPMNTLSQGNIVSSAYFTNGTGNYYGNTNIVQDSFLNGAVFTSDILPSSQFGFNGAVSMQTNAVGPHGVTLKYWNGVVTNSAIY